MHEWADRLRLYGEAFYYFAWRAREALAKVRRRLHSKRCTRRAQQPTSAVRRFDIDFVEMGEIVGEHLHEREANRRVVGQGHPQAPFAGCVCKRVALRNLLQDGFMGMSSE